MTRADVRKVIDGLKLIVLVSNGHGIEIRRAGYVRNNAGEPGATDRWYKTDLFGTWLEQRWRVYSGGGIAGNGDQWWLGSVGGLRPEKLGPYTSKSALTKALRQWRRWEIP